MGTALFLLWKGLQVRRREGTGQREVLVLSHVTGRQHYAHPDLSACNTLHP